MAKKKKTEGGIVSDDFDYTGLGEPVVLESKEEAVKTNLFEGKTALKDFTMRYHEHYFKIKKGDDLCHIPRLFFQNFKPEQLS